MVSTGPVGGTLTHAGGAQCRLDPHGQTVTAANVLTEAQVEEARDAIADLIRDSQTANRPRDLPAALAVKPFLKELALV